jgi:cellulose synthase/poly-beta-1,6-N-acetylglucosamine synthase-like glycosyltransferase
LFFLACVGLRLAALRVAVPPRPAELPRPDPSGLPVYSVLVALYREAEVVPDLLDSLDRLDWPRDRLDVKLVCEADDAETLGAIEAAGLPRGFEVIAVPPASPRTKPKALAFALPLARGDYVVLYDAEDEPHPMQLIEAWSVFSQAAPDLACLQAPLEISNGGEGLVARLFAFEYAALFRGLLPYLSDRRRLLPLGGTSNHFRRAVLEEVGGWDPYNVTEDADLGLRLARFGYRTATTTLPTREAAPTEFRVWLPQRTRWFKGWVQTWLVHMRRPAELARELGPGSWLIAQILFAGMFVSAIVHPMLVISAVGLAINLVMQRPFSTWQSGLLALDIANIACGYASFLLLGRQTQGRADRKGFWRIVLFTPVYWMMVSLAAWRALGQLWSRPHHWEKTPHKRRGAGMRTRHPAG